MIPGPPLQYVLLLVVPYAGTSSLVPVYNRHGTTVHTTKIFLRKLFGAVPATAA